MLIEIVNFYTTLREDSKQVLQGTLHVYLVDFGIDLRGIFVSKKKDCWYFSLPSRKAQDAEGRLIHYPITSYRDREKTGQLMQIIKEKGRAFIEEFLKNNPQLQEIEKEAKQPDSPTVEQKRNSEPAIDKKPVAPLQRISEKKWVDPPKRPPVKSKAGYGYAKR